MPINNPLGPQTNNQVATLVGLKSFQLNAAAIKTNPIEIACDKQSVPPLRMIQFRSPFVNLTCREYNSGNLLCGDIKEKACGPPSLPATGK